MKITTVTMGIAASIGLALGAQAATLGWEPLSSQETFQPSAFFRGEFYNANGPPLQVLHVSASFATGLPSVLGNPARFHFLWEDTRAPYSSLSGMGHFGSVDGGYETVGTGWTFTVRSEPTQPIWGQALT